ncbi:MAG TPA: TMEM175 family protein [Verrucomicrobiae bacterium]|nr:TMEM175 family protein [Verrucomicrobiae bacterium]
MEKNRVEAFSDGVIAIIITIMVLELRPPTSVALDQLLELLPVFLSYVLSFIYVGIYWNNHHHMFYATKRVTGGILWANLHLLFWLSLFPFATAWIDEHHHESLPVAIYGFVLLMAAIAYFILQTVIIRQQGQNSFLRKAVGRDWKGKASPLLYLAGILLAFVNTWISIALYVFVALLWLVPDRRIERTLQKMEKE